jgi:hypothetical protein
MLNKNLAWKKILFPTAFRHSLRRVQPTVQWVLKIKRQEHAAGHSLPSSADSKMFHHNSVCSGVQVSTETSLFSPLIWIVNAFSVLYILYFKYGLCVIRTDVFNLR